jgi:AAA15 family ATPase/GTPase
LKSVGIYGANASGKSNLIKAIFTMQKLVLDSADFKPGKSMPIKAFLLDYKSQKQASSFEVTFFHNGIRYQYGFTATNKRFEEEWLTAYPKGSAQAWYSRIFNKETGSYDWKYSTFLKGEKARLAEKTRENALFLSVGAQWNNDQLTNVYEWFKDNLRIVPPKDNFKPVTAEMLLDVEKEKDAREKLYDFVTDALQDADLGIKGVNVEKIKFDRKQIKFPDQMPTAIREKILKRLEKERPLKVETVHRNVDSGEDVSLMLEDESDGTQRFFQLLGPWLETATFGYTVFVDELEASLHPLLTRELVKFIQNPSVNKTGAQLIFATHDTTLLDPELFRRDQIWFTEKDKDSATNLYSTSDYKERRPRKGEAMQKGYLSGRYGAIPILESFGLK